MERFDKHLNFVNIPTTFLLFCVTEERKKEEWKKEADGMRHAISWERKRLSFCLDVTQKTLSVSVNMQMKIIIQVRSWLLVIHAWVKAFSTSSGLQSYWAKSQIDLHLFFDDLFQGLFLYLRQTLHHYSSFVSFWDCNVIGTIATFLESY